MELGEFLRARRGEVTPEQVGLPTTSRRRVSGLRREEVATLAGLSVDYYVRLEQGRERHPSTQVGSPQIMAAQMEHLIEATYRPNLRLGIIPWTTPVHSPALHCFTIFDDRAVIVGTETATAIITDPDDIADYTKRHAFYTRYTVVGDPARALLTRLAQDYRNLT